MAEEVKALGLNARIADSNSKHRKHGRNKVKHELNRRIHQHTGTGYRGGHDFKKSQHIAAITRLKKRLNKMAGIERVDSSWNKFMRKKMAARLGKPKKLITKEEMSAWKSEYRSEK